MGISDNIVISGVGGWLPKCKNIDEFKTALLEQSNLFDTRWKAGEFDVSNVIGKIPAVDLFDSSFFGVHRKQAMFMDPMHRMILERTFEAIVDAGVNPNDIRGKNIAVYTSSTISENDYLIFQVIINGFGVTGQSRTMLSNRISYWLNLKGPSCSYDNLWNNGILVLQAAYDAIKSGSCEAAIIGSTNLVINPHISYLFNQMGLLSPDGCTRSFDADGNGYGRSEAVIALFVQRESDAKRVYASIEHVLSTHLGDQETYFNDVPGKNIAKFLHDFYGRSRVRPDEIEFMEAYGAGIKSLDKKELDAIDSVFKRHANNPLLIGSIKSMAGHSEASASLMSVVKILIAMETKTIPANLHFTNPNPEIDALVENKLKVVVENTPWNGRVAAVNSLGMTGGFGHVIFKSNTRDKRIEHDDLPRLVLLSSRTEEGVEKMIETIHGQPTLDYEYIRLVHDVFSTNISGHLYRGYSIVDSKHEAKKESEFYSTRKRPLWFVYSGMGSQWNMMGKSLMSFPIFSRAIEKCHEVLVPKGIDLKAILIDDNETTFENILNSFVGIAAVQIGLTDLLKAMKIEPDGIIGHSVGELGCAYSDGCMTAEQMILSAYSRGKASIETELVQGMMAAVGLGYEQMKDQIPESIEIACHNGPDSCTISGPTEDMNKFVEELKAKGTFAKLVNVSNIAYHSRYIRPAAPKLLKYLKEVLPEPVKRSSKWISTSIPESNWDSELAQTSSAEYHTNNLLNAVLFEEGIKHIPEDSVVIEIAPHGLLQPILKRSLHASCSNISLTHRTAQSGIDYFLSSLGKIFLSGIDMNVAHIYPPIEYPVSRGTASLAPLVHWEHSESWHTGIGVIKNYQPGELEIQVSLNRKEFRDLIDYKLNQKIIFPPAGYLSIVWQIFRSFKGALNTNVTIFEEIKIINNFQVPFKGSVPLYIMVHKGSGSFELCQGSLLLVSGIIKIPESKENLIDSGDFAKCEDHTFTAQLDADVIYKELNYRGYEFSGIFRALETLKMSERYLSGTVHYQKSWMALIEVMLQMVAFKNGEKTQKIFIPYFIQKLVLSFEDLPSENEDLDVVYNVATGVVTTKGIQISGIKSDVYRPDENLQYKTEQTKFVSHKSSFSSLGDILNICLQIVLNNIDDNTSLSVVEHVNSGSLLQSIQAAANNFDWLQINLKTQSKSKKLLPISNAQTSVLVVGEFETLSDCITLIGSSRSFLILRTKNSLIYKNTIKNSFVTIAEFKLENSDTFEQYYLLRKDARVQSETFLVDASSSSSICCQSFHDESIAWVNKMRSKIEQLQKMPEANKLFVVLKKIPIEGIDKFVNEFKQVFGYANVNFIFSTNPKIADSEFCKSVSQQNLHTVVIYGNEIGNFYKFFEDRSQPIHYRNALTAYTNTNLTLQQEAYEYLGVSQDEDEVFLEYSGRDSHGVPVCGLIGTDFKPDPILRWNFPEKWSMEDAATTPMAYLMAYYCLNELVQLRKGVFALIHNACYPISQAFIDVLASYGAVVYTTVFNDEEYHFAKRRFRNIPDKNIIHYGNESFRIHLLNETSSLGFDLITSNLARCHIQASLCLMGFGGRFLQLPSSHENKKDFSDIGLKVFLKSTEIYGVKYEHLYGSSDEVKQRLREHFEKGVHKAVVKPLRRIVYENVSVRRAVQESRSNRHEKTLINVANKTAIHENINRNLNELYECDRSGSYVIIGDSILNDFFQMAEWLVTRGARHVTLCCSVDQSSNSYFVRISETFRSHYAVELHVLNVSASGIQAVAAHLKQTDERCCPIKLIACLNMNERDLEIVESVDAVSRRLKSQPVLVLIECEFDGLVNGRNQANLRTCNVHSERQRSYRFFSDILFLLNELLITQNSNKLTIKKDFENEFEESQKTKQNDKHLKLLLPDSAQAIIDFADNVSDDIELIPLPSLSPQRIREVPPIFIVPGLYDGSQEYLLSLCEKLLHPVFLVSLPKNVDRTASELADIVAKKILQIYNGPFNFIGISYGGIMTLEIVNRIEELVENAKVKIFFVDGAPKTTINSIKFLERKHSKAELTFLTLLLNIDSMDIISEMSSTASGHFDEILQVALKNIDQSNLNVDLTKDSFAKCLFEGLQILWHRVQEVLNCNRPVFDNKQLNAMMYLLRPNNCSLDDDCGLCVYSKQTVKVDGLNGDHRTIILDDKLSTFINENVLTFELQDVHQKN